MRGGWMSRAAPRWRSFLSYLVNVRENKRGDGTQEGDPGSQDGPCWEALRMRREWRWAGQLLKQSLQFKDQSFIYSDNNDLDFCDTLRFDPRNRKMGILRKLVIATTQKGLWKSPRGTEHS